MALIILASEYW